MKTYKIVRDIAIIIIALVVLNNQYTILENQALIAKSMIVLAEKELSSDVEELSTVNNIQDTTFVLDTIIVPQYKTISSVVNKTILDTIKVVNVIDSIKYNTITDTITISVIEPIKSDSTAIELEAEIYSNINTFVYQNETYKLVDNKLWVYHNNNWIKPNKLKSNRGKFTPHRLNKEYLSQVHDLIERQNTLASGSY